MKTSVKWLVGILAALVVMGALVSFAKTNHQSSAEAPITWDDIPDTPVVGKQVNSLDTEEKCGDVAKAFYNDFQTNPASSNSWAQSVTNSGGQLSYSNHYNARLSKCLIRIDGRLYKTAPRTGGYYDLTWLYDVYEHKLLASMNADSESNFNLCEFPASHNLGSNGLAKECGSRESFKGAVEALMGY
jgi:hypothetical protein